jgi:hypothetical protein
MRLPEKVTIRIIDRKAKNPVTNIAVSLVLYAHKKNDYYVGPRISDREGLIIFERDDCIKEIDNSKKFYLMDYASTMEQCLPKISVKIKPKGELENAVKKMRQLRDVYQDYWDCSEEYLKSLEYADNNKYVAKTYDFLESDLWQNKIIQIELERREALK